MNHSDGVRVPSKALGVVFVSKSDVELIFWGDSKWTATKNGVDYPSLGEKISSAYHRMLNAPEDGPPGAMLLKKVANDLGGKVVLPDPPEEDEDEYDQKVVIN